MPSWLQGFATYQPVSVTVSACRALMIGADGHLGHPAGSTTFWVVQSLAWTDRAPRSSSSRWPSGGTAPGT